MRPWTAEGLEPACAADTQKGSHAQLMPRTRITRSRAGAAEGQTRAVEEAFCPVQAPCRPRAGPVQARAGQLIFRAGPKCRPKNTLQNVGRGRAGFPTEWPYIILEGAREDTWAFGPFGAGEGGGPEAGYARAF